MSEPDRPQIYLVTPPAIELGRFPDQLRAILDAEDIACLRLSLATRDEDTLTRAADAIREVAHSFDVPVLIDTHVVLAQRLGLDGVHLNDGGRSIRAARETLGEDASIGAFCGQSRHDAMTAGENGADYVVFGPVSGALGDGELAGRDLFEWWTEVMTLPVIAEGGLTLDRVRDISPVTDLFAIGEEIWQTEDPLASLRAMIAVMS